MLLKKYQKGGKVKKKKSSKYIPWAKHTGAGYKEDVTMIEGDRSMPKALDAIKHKRALASFGKKHKLMKKAKGLQTGGKVLQKQSGREYRKSLENAPDLENDLWDKFISGGNMVLPQLVKEQSARDAKDKAQKMEKIGLKMPKAAGGSLPLGEGGKKKKKTTDMPHGAMIKERYEVFKGKMPQHKLMKKAKLLKK